MRGNGTHRQIHLEYIIAFIFCGAIIGETLSLSIVVSTIGPETLGKLYLANAIILLFLPLLFYKYIDKINRGKLLSNSLISTVTVITCLLVFIQIYKDVPFVLNTIILFLYPVAYLSKTVLFLTFWTLLNDIYSIQEAKQKFPVIAAWGFSGAFIGVIIARILLSIVSTQTVVGMWVLVYLAAWIYSRGISKKYSKQLNPVEITPSENKMFFGFSSILSIKLVKIISFFYFGVFITVFINDFVFWKNCNEWFKTSESIASFQLTFYLIHSSITIILLRYILPRVIGKVGFTQILYGLPVVFILGGMLLFFTYRYDAVLFKVPLVTGAQFFRHVFFELTFAPSYQMFFAVIVKEQRGRVKTFLEGLVKPVAILLSGIFIVSKIEIVGGMYAFIAINGVVLCVVIYKLRTVYSTAIIDNLTAPVAIDEIIEEAGQREHLTLLKTIEKYASAKEHDIRAVAIHLLKQSASFQSLATLMTLYHRERMVKLKEMIARSMSVFYNYRAKPFIEHLLKEENQRIRANAVHAVNEMHCNWKKHLKNIIMPMLFENNRRVQLEAAQFIWSAGTVHEKNSVLHFLQSLLKSKNTDRRSAGIYLVGKMQVQGWEEMLLKNLSSASMQVFTKSMEVILTHASNEVKQKALKKIEALSRNHMSITGKLVVNKGWELWGALNAILPTIQSRRLMFEMVGCLRKICDVVQTRKNHHDLSNETRGTLKKWIMNELESIYIDASYFYLLIKNEKKRSFESCLEEALREKQLRISEWALSVMVLIDKKEIMLWRSTDINVYQPENRIDIIEVIESGGYETIGLVVLPLLKQDSWENLYRIGRIYFHLNIKQEVLCFEHFLRSENRLIKFCALYVIRKNITVYLKDDTIVKVLEMLKNDNDDLISSGAIEILQKQNQNKISRERAFNLLERVLFFKHTILFHTISAEKLLRLVEVARQVEYKEGEEISTTGKVSDQLYIVKSGCIRVEKIAADNKISVIFVNQGETYGEVGLFSKAIRKSTAIAHTRTELFVIKGADMKRLIREIPDIAFNLLEVISGRLLESGYTVENKNTG